MTRPELHLITTGKQTLDELISLISCWSEEAKQALDVLHIREKHRTARELMEWVATLQTLLPLRKLHVNDRLDVAHAMSVGDVQLEWHSLSPQLARRLLGAESRIGVSVHSVVEARAAMAGGADFLLYGHLFATHSKEGLTGRGIPALHEVVRSTPLPVIAIGGINADNARLALSSGCAGVAVMSGVFLHSHPEQALLQIRAALNVAAAN